MQPRGGAVRSGIPHPFPRCDHPNRREPCAGELLPSALAVDIQRDRGATSLRSLIALIHLDVSRDGNEEW